MLTYLLLLKDLITTKFSSFHMTHETRYTIQQNFRQANSGLCDTRSQFSRAKSVCTNTTIQTCTSISQLRSQIPELINQLLVVVIIQCSPSKQLLHMASFIWLFPSGLMHLASLKQLLPTQWAEYSALPNSLLLDSPFHQNLHTLITKTQHTK